MFLKSLPSWCACHTEAQFSRRFLGLRRQEASFSHHPPPALQSQFGFPSSPGTAAGQGKAGCITEPGVGKGYGVLLAVTTCCVSVRASSPLLGCKRVGGKSSQLQVKQLSRSPPHAFTLMGGGRSPSGPPLPSDASLLQGGSSKPPRLQTANPLHPTLAPSASTEREGGKATQTTKKKKK